MDQLGLVLLELLLLGGGRFGHVRARLDQPVRQVALPLVLDTGALLHVGHLECVGHDQYCMGKEGMRRREWKIVNTLTFTPFATPSRVEKTLISSVSLIYFLHFLRHRAGHYGAFGGQEFNGELNSMNQSLRSLSERV